MDTDKEFSVLNPVENTRKRSRLNVPGINPVEVFIR
jgi:hypothetical protein